MSLSTNMSTKHEFTSTLLLLLFYYLLSHLKLINCVTHLQFQSLPSIFELGTIHKWYSLPILLSHPSPISSTSSPTRLSPPINSDIICGWATYLRWCHSNYHSNQSNSVAFHIFQWIRLQVKIFCTKNVLKTYFIYFFVTDHTAQFQLICKIVLEYPEMWMIFLNWNL